MMSYLALSRPLQEMAPIEGVRGGTRRGEEAKKGGGGWGSLRGKVVAGRRPATRGAAGRETMNLGTTNRQNKPSQPRCRQHIAMAATQHCILGCDSNVRTTLHVYLSRCLPICLNSHRKSRQLAGPPQVHQVQQLKLRPSDLVLHPSLHCMLRHILRIQ